ncbi:MAG: MBL fold metallo-hydrolase [Burkholderiales bacterium]
MNAPETLIYPFAQIPAPGACNEVAPGIYWVRMPLPFALDHINLWLLQDGDGWTIIDCGYGLPEVQTLWQKVFDSRLGGGTVKRIIATHYHPDHIGQSAWLTQHFELELWMPQAEFLTGHAVHRGEPGYNTESICALFRRHGLDETHLNQIAARGNSYQKGVPALPHRYRRIMDNEIITIDGKRWRVIMGYGHAPEHAALYCEELNVLISGDMILPRISTNVSVWPAEPEGDPLGLFLASIRHYAQLPADTLVLPSHGVVFRGLRKRVNDLECHHEERLGEMRAACATPLTAAQLMQVLFKRELDSHQVFFAMGETIAHLNYLMHRGEVSRLQNAAGVYRFTRAL